jgi:hypothetical protein
MKKKCIVILGMHRSGTSALTGFLQLLGLHAGNKLLPGNKYNAKGYFECADIVTVHDELLDELGSSWHDVPPLSDGWASSPAAQQAKSKLISIFNAEFGAAEICVLKDPRMCRLLPLWQEIFLELGITPTYIIVARAPDEVVASLACRNDFHTNKSLLLYLRYLLDAELHTHSSRRLVLDFADLLHDWETVLPSIISALDLALPPISAATMEAVRTFLSPELRHFNAGPILPDGAADTSTRMARKLYRLLAVQQDPTFASEMDKLRVAFGAHLQTLEPWMSLASKAERLEREFVKPGRLAEEVASSSAKSVLYWCTRGNPAYNEGRTLAVPYHFGGVVQTLEFVFLPEMSNLIGFRLDLIDRPAYCQLHALRLVNDMGSTVWEWDKREPIFSVPSDDMHLLPGVGEEAGAVVFSSGFDPYAQLNFPIELLTQISGGWRLIVEVAVQLPNVGLPFVLNNYDQCAAQLNILSNTLAEREQSLAQANHKAGGQAVEIATLNKVNQQCREEILRAESQLELLKELMLSDGAVNGI